MSRPACADVGVAENRPLAVGSLTLKPLFTPGHTDHHYSYLIDNDGMLAVFTGDALLIDGCGRADFQSGDAAALCHSATGKLFSLPAETLVYPAHDYNEPRVSSVGQERERNPRLGKGKTLEQFVYIMDELDLPYPKKIDLAVPANKRCGELPADVHSAMGGPSERSLQG